MLNGFLIIKQFNLILSIINSFLFTFLLADNGETDRNFAPNKCEFWLISNSGNITSFGDYKQNVNCIYRVTPIDSTVCQLELYFDDFDVKDIRSETNNNAQIGNIEREFAQLSSRPESCVDNYLEFNNRKRYCHQDWKNRMDIVEIDPNYEKDFVFRYLDFKLNLQILGSLILFFIRKLDWF